MNAQQQQTLDRLFEEAIALPTDKRAAFIAQNCTDPEVLSELESLITCASDAPLSRMLGAIGDVATSAAGEALLGLRVGSYRLVQWIGEGGMGTVYRAVRDDNQ